jgi:predicted metal-dependent enzyme (double-stranded beta helix superfamily)
MAVTTYTVQDFVQDARAIVARRMSEVETMEAIVEPLERLISRADCLADIEGSTADPDRGFTIYRAEDLSILAVVWPKDGGAPIHNHNGWALEGVINGVERNRNYQRLDDGSEPWRAKLEEVDPSIVTAGQTTSLALPPNDIHAVEVPAGKTLAIHVYGIDLARQWRYQFDQETGEVRPFRGASRR